jgi:gliding motility-associated-like protein
MNKFLHLIFFALLMAFNAQADLQAQGCDCTNCPLTLPDQLTQTFTGTLVVQGATNNTLGTNNTLQQVCINITHDWIGDLDITLIAPNGTQVVLFGDGNNDTSLGGTETCPCGNSGDDMNVCFVLSGTTNDFSLSNAGTGNICNGNQGAYVACNGTGGQPCYTGNWLPYDQNCNGPDAGLSAMNNGGSVNGTWQLIIHDNAGSNQGILNDFSLVFANTTGINCNSGCNANAGTTNATGGTGTGSNATTRILCSGESVSLVSNDNYVLPNPMTGEASELMYAIYECAPPANPNPDVDACYSGLLWTAEDFNTANGGSYVQNIGGGIPQPFIDLGVTGTNNTLWFVPITCDDSDNNGNPNGIINWDQDGDNCFDLGTPIAIVYSAVPDVIIVPDCNPNTNNGSVTFTVIGSGTYTINETGAGNLTGGTSINAGQSFTINNLNNTNVWSFSLSQGGCATTFSGTFACAADICLVDAVIIPNPPPSNFPNNQYPPNTTVTFCIDINQYNQTNLNFLHGIVPSFSGGWQSTITPTTAPSVAALNEQGSYWQWQAGNTILHNNGTNSNGDNFNVANPGWWFHSVNSTTNNTAPTNAANSWGDGCTPICYPNTTQAICQAAGYQWVPGCGCTGEYVSGTYYDLWVGPSSSLFEDIVDNSMTSTVCAAQGGDWDSFLGICAYNHCIASPTTGMGLNWYACFQLTTLADPACLGNTNLNVSVQTYADGLTGAWDEYGCTADAPVTWTGTMCCLPAPTENTAATFCQGTNITLTANAPTAGQINWFGNGVATGGTPIGVGNSFNVGTLAPGSYTYYIEANNGGCTSNRTPVAFTVNPLPTLTIINGDAISCTAGSAVNISLTAANIVGNVTWTSSPAGFTATGTSINPTPSVTTTYTASATNGCGTVTVPISVTINTITPPNVPNSTLCGASTTLNAGAGYSGYAWSASGGGTISGASNVQTITVTSAGTYTVTVTNNGCTATDNAVVSAPTNPTITGPTSVCSGGSITLDAGAGYNTYSWSNSGGSGQTATFNNVTANTTYTVTVTTASGCTLTDTHAVTVTPLPAVSASSNSPVCEGGTLNLTSLPNGATSYAWAGPSGYTASTQNPTRSPVTAAMAGTYSVTVTNSGCSASTTVSVTVNSAPNAAAGSPITICSGNSLALSASGGGTYSWSGPNSYTGTGATPTVSAAATTAMSGTYVVTVTGANSCAATASQSVTVNATPTANAGSDVAKCSTAPAVSIGSAPIGSNTYVWSPTTGLSNPNIANPTANPTGTTTYTVTVTNPTGGCTATDQVVVTVNTAPTANAGTDISKCSADPAVSIGSATVAGNTYLWSPTTGLSNANIANPTANPTSTTTYTVTVTSGSGANTCTATDQVIVTVNPSPNLSTSSTPTICNGQSYNLATASVTDANSAGGALTYHSGTPAVPANQLASSTVSPTATTTYYILSTTGAGCSDEVAITVTVNQPNTATVTASANVCNSSGGTGSPILNLSALITGGNTSGTWADTDGTGVSLASPASVNFTGVTPNTYTFTYTTPAAAPCAGQAYTVEVTVNNCTCPNVATNAPSGPLCSNAAISFNLTTLQTAAIAPGTWSITAQPAGASATISGTTFNAPVNTPAGNYTVTYTASSPAGAPCPPSSSQTIVVNAPANAGTNGTITVCSSDTPFNLFASLGGSPAAGGTWTSGGSPTGNTFDPAVQSSGVFTYTVTSPAGCPDATATVTVTVNTTPTPSSGSPINICSGQPLNLSASGGTTYAWSGPNAYSGTGASPNVSNSATVAMSGTYNVTVTSGTCSATTSQNVTVNPSPIPSSGAAINICAGQTINLSASGGTSYTWSGPNAYTATGSNPSLSNATTAMSGTYNVTVTDGACSATTNQNVTVNAIPTASSGSPVTVCEGQPINLSASGGTSYSWSGPNSFSASSQNPQVNTSATAAMAGIYTVTVSNAAGCSSTAQQTVAVNPIPIASTGSALTVCVGDAINLSASGGTSYSWSGPNSFSASSQNPQVSTSATTAMQGNYNVTVTDGNSCTATAQQQVTVNAPPPVSLTPFSNICQLNSPIALGNNVGTVSGNWSGNGVSANSFNPSGLSGVVTLTFTPTAGQCLAANTTTITVDAPIVPTLSVSPTTMCATDGAITLNTTQSGITGVWSGSGVSGNSFDPIGLSGSITLTFTANAGQCANNNTINITVTAPTSVTLTPLSPICDIAAPISLATTQSGVTGTWSGTGVSGNTFDPSGQSGTVTLTFTPDNGQCRLASTVDITVNTALPTTLQSFAGLCSLDAAIPLPTTQGGLNGTWSGIGVSANNFNPSGLSGAITLTFTPSGTQCALPNTTTIAVNPASAAAPSGIGDQCATGGIVPLSTTQGGLNGTWSGTGVSANSFNPSGLSGPVTLTFTPAAGQCATAGTITINVIAPATAGNDANSTACDNASEGTSSIDLSTLTSVAGGTFAPIGSAPALTGATFNGVGLSVGTTYQYSYTVAATPPCSDAVATVSITVNDCASCPNPPTAGFSYASPYCANAGTATITLSAGASAGTFTAVPAGLSINATTGAVNLATSTPGTYTVTNSIPATGACPPATATADITINAIPTLTDPSDQSICVGQNTALVTFNGTPVGTTFAWTNSNPAIGLGASGNGDIPAFATTGAGTATITVTPTFNGCVGTAQTFAITANALPTVNVPADVAACAGVTTAAVSFSGTVGASFAWTNSNPAIGLAASGNGNLPSFTAINSGSSPITATITVTPSLGTAPNICTGTPATFTITINPPPTANAGADQDICAGSSASLSASGGTSYQWSNGLGNAANATASPATTTTYTVTVTDNGCSATDAVAVNVAAMPTLVIGTVDCSADLTNYTINYTATNGTATASAGTLGATSVSNIPIATTPVTVTVTSTINTACLVSEIINAPNCACPSIAAPTGNDATICQGATIPALTVNVGAGLSVNWYATPSGGTALASNSNSYTPTTAGTYYAEAIDATTGCTSATRTPIVLTITPLPIANAGADQDICAGSSANLTASGGTSYQWSSGLGNAANTTASPATTTTYTVTVSDNGCSATDDVTVNVAAMPTLVIGAVDCSADLTNYTINYTASNGTATASAGTLGATSVSNIPIATTPVTITVTSATNAACLVSQDVNAPNCNCPSIAAPTGNDATICQGAAIPALTVNVSAGLSVNWYATPSGGTALLSNSTSYTPTTAGTYYAEAVDAATGCTSATRTPIVLTITPLPIANAGSDQDICAGSNANLTASGGTTYQWSNGLGNAANATASPATTTTYTVTVTDNGCSATDAVAVNVAAMPTLVIGTVDCSADLTNYTINYTASNGTATASAGTLGATSVSNIPIATTPVIITVTSATNAACLVSQDVNAPNCNCPSIAAPTGNDATICQGATIPALTVNVGAGLSVNWYATPSGGAALLSNSTSYTPTTAGTYYAEAIDATTGCTSATRTPIVLTITPLPSANAGADQDICAGSSANLTASGGTSYQWSNGLGNAANATASPALTTTYTVTVTDNGCSATDDVTVNVAAMPTLVIGTVDCSADLTNYTINYTATNGTATASAGTLGATSISNIPIATTPVTITVTSATNAACLVSQDVNAPNCNCPSIAAPTGNDATICQGATIPALTVNVGAGLSVNWYATPSGGAALLSNSNSYTPTTAGTYYAEAIDATTGCTSATRTPITLTITPLPTANAGSDQDICAGSSANLTASGGTSYQWSNGLGNAANATASPATTTTYTVTVTDNGCSATDAVAVNVAAMPTLVIGTVDCSADLTNYTINYTATNGTTTASAGTFGATSISNIPIATTPVTITVTSATNTACLVSQDVNAPNCNCPSIAAPTGNDATICQGATIPALTVNVGAGLSVNWYATPSGGAALSSNSNSYTPTTAGTYYAEAIDATTGCTSATRTPIVLTVTPLPIANAGADQDICAGSSANLTASGGTSYQWSNGLGNAANATASPATTTTYTVTVSDNGCSATDDVTVNVAAMPTLVIGTVDCSADLTNYTINYTATNGTATASAGTLGATSVSNIPIATTPVTITVTSATNAACLVSQDVNAPNCNCPSIAAPTGNDATICQGVTIPALTVNVGAGLSVNWYATPSGGAVLLSNSNSYTPTTAGTYYAEAIDATTGCTSATRTPIVLTITPLPSANAGADQDICAGSDANLTASGGTSYQWSNGLGNAANATASPATTTTYTVTVSDNGCSATDDVTVNVAAMPTLVIGTVDCSADLTNYTINYTATNGTATASAGTLGATSVSNIPIATTPVTITVTSATNTACLVSQDVNAPNCNCPSIAAPTGNDATICQGATIPALTVNVGAGLSVNWYATPSGGTALASNSTSYTPTTAGTYYAEAIDATTGCTSATRTPIVLTITPLPIANAGADQDICAGSDANLTASGGTSYQWSNGLGNAANATASPATTTTYTVTVTDNGCSATDAVAVNVNPLADAGNDNSAVVCDNATEGTTVVNLTTLTSVGGGLFAPIGTAPALTGTNFDGAGVALGTYEYSYTVSGIAPCVDDIATISITVNDCSACPNPPTANFTFDAAYCVGSGTATPTMTGTATSGVWSASPAGLSINAATGEINLATSTAGNYTITNSVAAAGACPAVSATFNITLNNPVNAGNDNTADVCDNATDGNTTVDLSTLASVAGGTFTPVAGAPALSGTTFDGAGVALGTYQYDYTVLGTAPCSDDVASISITVNSCFVNSCPTIVTPLDTAFALCVDKDPDLPALTDAIVFNGTSNTFAGFAWYSDATLTTPVVPADYAYSGDNCAEQQVTLYVAALCTIDPAPIAAGSLSLILYPPFDSLLLTSTAVECAVPTLTSSCDNYVITPENVPTVVNPGDSGMALWTVSYNGSLGIEPCFSEPFEVAYSCPAIICPIAAFTLSNDSLCVGDAVTLTFTGTSTPTTTYSWNIAGQTLSGIGPHNVTVNTSGILEVELIVNDGAACADTSTLDLAVSNVSLIVTATPTNVVSGASVQLNASASSALGLDINYTWTDHSSLSCLTCTTPTALPTENTIYSVAVSDELGCAASGSIAVNVFQENIAVAPSAFSPNGDNIDDIFHISGSNIASIDLYIYNRWGNEVYSAQEISTSEGWDGKFNGEYVDVAVFVYYANVHYSDGKEDFLRGNITVVR